MNIEFYWNSLLLLFLYKDDISITYPVQFDMTITAVTE